MYVAAYATTSARLFERKKDNNATIKLFILSISNSLAQSSNLNWTCRTQATNAIMMMGFLAR